MPGGDAQERYSILLSRLTASKQWDRALITAREWLAEDPEATTPHRAAAQTFINLHQYKSASPHLEKVLSVHPNDGFACRLASIANFHQGRYNRADECIQRAIRLQPGEAMHWYHLAWMRHRHGARGMALKHARRALELAPNHADIINLVAICERGEPEQRLAHYRRALELDPGNAVVHNNMGAHHLLSEKDYLRAIESFRQALALNPADKAAQGNLLIALRKRDSVHQSLQSPSWLLIKFAETLGRWHVHWVPAVVLALLCATLLLPVYLPWLVFVRPFLGAYDLLLKRDIQAQAGLIGARRGGWLGFWRWPRRVRTGIVLIAYAACWIGLIAFLGHILPARSELPPFFYDEQRVR